METKRVVTLIAFVLLMGVGFVFYFLIYSKQPPIQGLAIGNGRDAHGCIEGYKWNETDYSCMQMNSQGEIKYQVIDFQSCSDAGYAINENNKTGLLQCNVLNGTVFIQNSTENLTQMNNTGVNYPDSILLTENFTISSNVNLTNSTNSSKNIS